MPRVTNAELRQRIAALEAENERLRDSIVTAGVALDEAAEAAATTRDPAPGARKGRGWGWALLSVVLVVIGAVLAPAGLVAGWAKTQLTDTEGFVSTYAPLAQDAGVQAFITDQTMVVIQENVDIPAITSDVVDGITSLGTGPAATRALEALKGPAAQGIASLVRSSVQGFVSSDAFSQVFREALRVSHQQLVATMQNDPNAAVAVASDGSIGVQLAPVIERVKQLLVDQGLSFASSIPTVDYTITIAQQSSLPTVQLFYGLAVSAGAWLPWIALLFLVAGVVVARRRSTALIATAVALALAMLVVVVAFAIGSTVFAASVSPSIMPTGVASTVFTTVTQSMQNTAVAVLVLAVVVAVVGWLAGPFAVPRRLRRFATSGADAIRRAGDRFGLSTGAAGEWMHRQRLLLRIAVAVIAAAVVLFVRPLTTGLIVWTLVLAAVVLAILEIVQRPPADAAAETLEEEAAAVSAAAGTSTAEPVGVAASAGAAVSGDDPAEGAKA
jgi:hypothetical protein